MRFNAFIGPAYRSQSIVADGERLMNFYLEKMQSPGAKFPTALYPSPGFELFLTGPDSPGRGLFAQLDRAWAVLGSTIVELSELGVATAKGAVAQNARRVTMVTNGDGGGELLVGSGNKGYVLDLTSGVLTQVADDVFQVGMLDGFFLYLDVTTSTIFISDQFDGLTWDPLQNAQRTASPDKWRALLVTNRIWLFGEQTSDVWGNTGASPFPFAPIAGAVIPYGIVAADSAADYKGSPVWLAQNKDGARIVVRATGYASADKISDYAVDYAIRTYTRVDDAEGWIYQEDGHDFYVLSFPSANATWVYDEAGGWSERGTWNPQHARYDAWRPRAHAYAFGQHLVCDRNTGSIYRMSNDLGVDVGGGPLRRVRRAPGLWQEARRTRYPAFELVLENGLGLSTGQGSEPLVALRTSRNGGRTMGHERLRRAGAIGKFHQRVRWNQCGGGRDMVFEVVMSDPIPWRLSGAFLREKK